MRQILRIIKAKTDISGSLDDIETKQTDRQRAGDLQTRHLGAKHRWLQKQSHTENGAKEPVQATNHQETPRITQLDPLRHKPDQRQQQDTQRQRDNAFIKGHKHARANH